MQKLLFLLSAAAVTLTGCAVFKDKSRAWNDPFEQVKVAQMVGNNVSRAPLQRTILCLNARRETRIITGETNVVVTYYTNQVVTYQTNYSINSVTNLQANLSTNQLAPVAPPLPVDTNDPTAVVVQAPPPQGLSTNTSLTRTADQYLTINTGKDQSVTTLNLQSSLTQNHQLTATFGNQAVTVATNQTIRTETIITITALTNYLVTAKTNVIVSPVTRVIHDHYLFTELTPPPDFTLAPGENLILVLDGQRHGFAPTNSPAFQGRREFVSTLYKVSPEVLVQLANAREAKLRLRGVNYAIERSISRSCQQKFREFLVRYYPGSATLEDLKSLAKETPSAPSQP
ncbi:MAG: hypothetical protein N3J91_00345 [Verrucomicrobiae bacterium]|nr:hypothetical protein [Verrucomicrobiae bacterium]